MFCGQRLKYIALFLLVAFIIFSCGKDPDDPVFNNPNDPLSPNYKTGQSQLPSSITGKDGALMALIPAGEFQMGSNDNAKESPVHTVYLDPFYMDKYEVTNAQYKRFVQETGHNDPEGIHRVNGKPVGGFKPWKDNNFNGDNQPIVCISWDDAKAYAEWVGKRLPTEAEWEKAARGGLIGKKYTWGDTWSSAIKSWQFC